MKIAKTTLFSLLAAFIMTGSASASVSPDWAMRSPINGTQGGALAVDADGNAYVATLVQHPGHSNIGLIKYDAAGNQQWARDTPGIGLGFDFPAAIAINSLGNIVVTGASWRGPTALNYEVVTRAYNTAGDTLWVARFNGLSGRDDRPVAMTVDGSGNTYVAGYANATSLGGTTARAFLTIKYGPTGALLWYWTFSGNWTSGANAIALDPLGNVYVTGGAYENNPSFEDYLTIRYNANGTFGWASRYAGPIAANDEATAIAVDDSSNVYVTGRSGNSSDDIATVKYNSSGVQSWARRFDGPDHLNDAGVGIGVDGSHNVYVTGREGLTLNFNSRDIVTMKYSGAGDSLWIRRYATLVSSIEEPMALRVDGVGNSLVLARSYGAGSTPYSAFMDYLTLGYGADGTPNWEARYAGPGDGDDFASAMAVGVDNSLYVTGASSDYSLNNGYASTIKYSRATTGVAPGGRPSGEAGRLSWVHPNPCVQVTTIQFELPSSAAVRLRVLDLQGREVASLVDGVRAAGTHSVRWDASGVPAGVYFYQLRAGARVETRRIAVIR